MAQATGYTVVRVNEDKYALQSTRNTVAQNVAFIGRSRDRLGHSLGWKLNPLLCMQGSRSKVWTTAAEAIASTKLMTPGQAKSAVTQADGDRDVAPREPS